MRKENPADTKTTATPIPARQTGIERLFEAVKEKHAQSEGLMQLLEALGLDFAEKHPEADEALWYLLNRK